MKNLVIILTCLITFNLNAQNFAGHYKGYFNEDRFSNAECSLFLKSIGGKKYQGIIFFAESYLYYGPNSFKYVYAIEEGENLNVLVYATNSSDKIIHISKSYKAEVNYNAKNEFILKGNPMQSYYNSSNFYFIRQSLELPKKYEKKIIPLDLIEVTSIKTIEVKTPTRECKIEKDKPFIFQIILQNRIEMLKGEVITFTANSFPKNVISNRSYEKESWIDSKYGISIGYEHEIKTTETEVYFSEICMPGYSTPNDSITFTINMSIKGLVFDSIKIVVPSNSDFKLSKSNNPFSSETSIILDNFYGLNTQKIRNIVTQNDDLANNNNSKALMWRSFFYSIGEGGYPNNSINSRKDGLKVFNDIKKQADLGDAESTFLLAYAYTNLMQDSIKKQQGIYLLNKLCETEYLPALYTVGLISLNSKNYKKALTNFLTCYNKSMSKAAAQIGNLYENGLGVEKDMSKAIEWYKIGKNSNDGFAFMKLATIYCTNVDYLDYKKGISLLKEAIKIEYTPAHILLSEATSKGLYGLEKNEIDGKNYLLLAAKLNNPKAIEGLVQYYKNENDLDSNLKMNFKDSLFYWVERGSILGSPILCALLSSYYKDGFVADKSVVKERYWYNRALDYGFQNDGKLKPTFISDWQILLGSIDLNDYFTPNYKEIIQNGNGTEYSVTRGGDFSPLGFLSSMASAYINSRTVDRELINNIEVAYKLKDEIIYCGTISTKTTNQMQLKKGDTLHIQSQGKIKLGWQLFSDPDGVLGHENYNLCSGRHGALMAISNGSCIYIGSKEILIPKDDMILDFIVNDKDDQNNQGYYDFEIIKTSAVNKNIINHELTTVNNKNSNEFANDPDLNTSKYKLNEFPIVTPSGLRYITLKEGTGVAPTATSTVKVHYTGTFVDGKVFDSSVQRGEPIEFPLANVIKGWTEGLQLMKEGGKSKFYIPYNLAYGEQGVVGAIPPKSDLIFEVELLQVK